MLDTKVLILVIFAKDIFIQHLITVYNTNLSKNEVTYPQTQYVIPKGHHILIHR